jgi:hypothetical protein
VNNIRFVLYGIGALIAAVLALKVFLVVTAILFQIITLAVIVALVGAIGWVMWRVKGPKNTKKQPVN